MARINVEDGIWTDPRFMKLCIRLGDEARAVGTVVIAWRNAQSYWLPGKKPIPMDRWKAIDGGQAMIDADLAEMREDGVYVRGTEEAFKWWFEAHEQRKESGRRGGVVSASKAERGEDGKFKPRPVAQLVQAKPSDIQAEPSKTNPSSSSSFSVSNTNTKNLKTAPQSVAVPADNPIGRFVGTYVKAFQSKYGEGTRPDLSGKVQGEIKRFLKDTPIDRACSLIQVYFQMDDRWFETKGHDFSTFAANLGKIGVALDTGKSSGGIDWDKFHKLVGDPR